MSSTQIWANYLVDRRHTTLPDAEREKTKLHLLDTIAAIISGHELAAGRAGQRLARRLGGASEATVFSRNPFGCGAIEAGMANAMAAHADETDDSHLRGRFHPGCSIVPTALACAELFKSNAEQVLSAICAGYDIGARAVIALGIPEHQKPRFSTHTIGGHWGAAATAILLSPMSEQQARWALSFTAQQISGIPYWRKDTAHIEKSFDFGAMAARNALFTALAIGEGWSGCEDVLEGPESYLSAFGQDIRPDELTRALGNRYEIRDATIKKWCVGSPIQAVLDSTKYLIDLHQVRASMVQRIEITLPDDRIHIVDNREMPDVCVQHLVAIAILDGTVGFSAAHNQERMADPAIQKIRQKIFLKPSKELTIAKPARQAMVAITLDDGSIVSRHTKAVLGTPDNPMTTEQVQEKARDLIEPLLGREKCIELITSLEEFSGTQTVTDLFRRTLTVDHQLRG